MLQQVSMFALCSTSKQSYSDRDEQSIHLHGETGDHGGSVNNAL